MILLTLWLISVALVWALIRGGTYEPTAHFQERNDP